MAENDFVAMSSLLSTWKPFSTGDHMDSLMNEIENQTSNHLELLRTGKDSDLKIRCGGAEWNVHHSVLCPRSAYFTAICDGNFRVWLSFPHNDLAEIRIGSPVWRYRSGRCRRCCYGSCSPPFIHLGLSRALETRGCDQQSVTRTDHPVLVDARFVPQP